MSAQRHIANKGGKASQYLQNLQEKKQQTYENKVAAVGALLTLCSDENSRQDIREGGGIPMLLGVLSEAREAEQIDLVRTTCGALLNLATDDESREQIREYSGVELLLDVVEDWHTRQKEGGKRAGNWADRKRRKTEEDLCEYATGALLNMSSDEETRDIFKSHSGVRTIYPLLSSDNAELRKTAVGSLASFVVDQDVVAEMFQADPTLDAVVQCLYPKNDSLDEDLLMRAIGCCWNLCVGSEEARMKLAEAGMLERLVEVVIEHGDKNGDPEVLSNALMCICLASINEDNADKVREIGGLSHIVKRGLTHEDDQVAQSAAAAVWNMSHSDANKEAFHDLKALEHLIILMSSPSEECLEKVLGATLTLCLDEQLSDQFRELGGFDHLGSMMDIPFENERILTYTLITLGVLSYVDQNRDAIRECGALATLVDLLTTSADNEKNLEKTTGALVNLTINDGNKDAIRQLDGIAPMISLLYHPNLVIQQNAAGALWHLSSNAKNREVIRKLGGLQPLLTLIDGGVVKPKSKTELQRMRDEMQSVSDSESDVDETLAMSSDDDSDDGTSRPRMYLSQQDDDDLLPDEPYTVPLQVDGKPRDTAVNFGEHGVEDGLKECGESAVLRAASRLDIARRLRDKRRQEQKRRAQKESGDLQAEAYRHKQRKRITDDVDDLSDLDDDFLDELLQDDSKTFTPSVDANDAINRLNKEANRFRDDLLLGADNDKDSIIPLEKQIVDDATRQALQFVNDPSCSEKPQEEIDDKRRQLEKTLKPIAARTEIRKRRDNQTEEDDKRPSHNRDDACERLQEAVDQYKNTLYLDPQLAKHLTDEEKQHMKRRIDDAQQILDRNDPSDGKNVYDSARAQIHDELHPVVDNALAKHDIKSVAQALNNRINNDDVMSNALNPQEKNQLNRAVKDILYWLGATDEQRERVRDLLIREDVVFVYSYCKPIALVKIDRDTKRIRNVAFHEEQKHHIADLDRKTIDHTTQATLDRLQRDKHSGEEDADSLDAERQTLRQELHPRVLQALQKRDTEASRDGREALHRLMDTVQKYRDVLLLDAVTVYSSMKTRDKNHMQEMIDNTVECIKEIDGGEGDSKALDSRRQKLDQSLSHIASRAMARGDLHEYAQGWSDRISKDGDLVDIASEDEKKRINAATSDTLQWLAKNEDSKEQEVERKAQELYDKLKSIMARVEKIATMRDYAKEVQQRLDHSDPTLVDKLDKGQQRSLKQNVNDVLKLVEDPEKATNAEMHEIDRVEKKLDEEVRPAVEMANLQRQIDELQERLQDTNENPEAATMTQEKKNALQKGIDNAREFIKDAKKNPTKQLPLGNVVEQQVKLEASERNAFGDNKSSVANTPTNIRHQNKIEHDEIQKRNAMLDDMSKDMIEKVDLVAQLDGDVQHIKQRLTDDPVFMSKVTPEEKEFVERQIGEVMDVLNYPEALQKMSKNDVQDMKTKFEDDMYLIVSRIDAINNMHNYAHNLRRRIHDDDDELNLDLDDDDKIALEDVTGSAMHWADEVGRDSSMQDVDDKRRDVAQQMRPITAQIAPLREILREDQQEHKQPSKDGDDARKRLDKRYRQYRNGIDLDLDLQERMTPDERAVVEDKLKTVKEFLDSNKDIDSDKLDKDMIDENRKQMDKVLCPVLDKAVARADLSNHARQIKQRVTNDDKFGTEDKHAVENAVDDVLKWVDRGDGKQSTEKQVIEKKKQLDAIVAPLIAKNSRIRDQLLNEDKSFTPAAGRRDAHDKLQNEINKLRDAVIMENGALAAHVPDSDKKNLEKRLSDLEDQAKDTSMLSSGVDKMRRELYDLAGPIVDDSTKKLVSQKSDHKEDARQRLLDQVQKYSDAMMDPEIGKSMTEAEKQKLGQSCQSASDAAQLGSAMTVKLDQQRDELDKVSRPLLGNALARSNLGDYAQKLLERVNEHPKNTDPEKMRQRLNKNENANVRNACQKALDWLDAKYKGSSGPSDTEVERKACELDASVRPMLNKVETVQTLEQHANQLKQKLERDDKLREALPSEEVRAVEKLIEDTLSFVADDKKVQNASVDDVEKRRRELDDTVYPVMQRGEATKQLLSYAEELQNKLDEEQRGQLQKTIDEVKQWVRNHPKATAEEIAEKRRELEKAADALMDVASEREKLKKYAEEAKRVMLASKILQRDMTFKERSKIEDYANDLLNWMHKNPNATLEQLREAKKRFDDQLQSIAAFKIDPPDVTYVGYNFEERMRWGDMSKRTTDITQYYAMTSFLKAEEKRKHQNLHEKNRATLQDKLYVAPTSVSPSQPRKFKIEKKERKPKPPVSEEDNELLKMFEKMKQRRGDVMALDKDQMKVVQ